MKSKSLIKRWIPLIAVIAAIVVMAAVAVPTIAYYIRTADNRIDTDYTEADHSAPSFQLGSDGNTSMSDVYIYVEDEGYPVYVRAEIIVSWKKLADCTCTQPVCGAHYCNGCNGCEECDGLVCEESCEDCAEDGGDCTVIPPCDECSDGEACLDCTNCEGCQGVSECGVCADCDRCPDREECPVCNEDPSDDWDVFYAKPVEGTDYTMELDEAWIAGEELADTDETFFYYPLRVASSGTVTNPLSLIKVEAPVIKEFKLLDTATPPLTGYVLHVEIIVQTVQAIGSTDLDDIDAWKDAWSNIPY